MSIWIQGLGAAVEIVGAPADDALWHPWQRCVVPAPVGAVVAEPISYSPTISPSALTQEVTRRLISARAGQILLFHAGAVSHPLTGATLVFVGKGGTGKTTLSRLLGRQYGYLTDETAAITADRRVLPYPKPLSLITPGVVGKVETSPEDLELLAAHPNPRVARLVLLDRDGTARPRAEKLDLLAGVAALTAQSSSLSKMDRGLHQMADLLRMIGPAQRWRYRDSEDLWPLVTKAIGRP